MDARQRAMRRAAELGRAYLAGLGERRMGAIEDDTTRPISTEPPTRSCSRTRRE